MKKYLNKFILSDVLTCFYCRSRLTLCRMKKNHRPFYIHRMGRKMHCPLKIMYSAIGLNSFVMANLNITMAAILANEPIEHVKLRQLHDEILNIQKIIHQQEYEVVKFLGSQNSEPRQWDDKMRKTLRKMMAKKIRIENELGKQVVELERRQTTYSMEIEMAVYLQDIKVLLKMPPKKTESIGQLFAKRG